MGWPPSLRGDIPEHRHVLERYHAPVGCVHVAAELYYLHHLGRLLYVGESAVLVVEGHLDGYSLGYVFEILAQGACNVRVAVLVNGHGLLVVDASPEAYAALVGFHLHAQYEVDRAVVLLRAFAISPHKLYVCRLCKRVLHCAARWYGYRRGTRGSVACGGLLGAGHGFKRLFGFLSMLPSCAWALVAHSEAMARHASSVLNDCLISVFVCW